MLRLSVTLVCVMLVLVPRAAAADSAPSPVRLKIVTYNVLADPVHVETRLPALFRILQESDADIIVLQEFTSWMAERLLREPWVARYHRPMRDGKTVIPHEYLLLSRYPVIDFISQPLPGPQHRILFAATLDIDGIKTALASCHLESRLEDGNIRAQQLDRYFAHLTPFEEAFFAGDFNFGDGEQPDSRHLPHEFQDAWTLVHPKDPGYTWDVEKSEFARRESFPNEGSRRLDRVLFKSTQWRPVAATILGDQPLDGKRRRLFPSDHFGLLTIFERKDTRTGQPATAKAGP